MLLHRVGPGSHKASYKAAGTGSTWQELGKNEWLQPTPKACYLETPLLCNSTVLPGPHECPPIPNAWVSVTMWGPLSSSASAHKAPCKTCPISVPMSNSASNMCSWSSPHPRTQVEPWVLSRGQEVPAKLWTSLSHQMTRVSVLVPGATASGLNLAPNFQHPPLRRLHYSIWKTRKCYELKHVPLKFLC